MINLLPPDIKTHQSHQSKIYLILLTYAIVLIVIALGFISLTTYNYVAGIDLEDKKNQIDSLSAQEKKFSAAAEKAGFINSRLNQTTLYSGGYDWDKVLGDVASSTPTDTVLSDINISNDPTKATPSATITGDTPSRRSIVLFQKKLEDNPQFSSTTISSVTELEEDEVKSYKFSISVTLKK